MPRITTLLSKLAPEGLTDALKGSITGSIKSQLSGFLSAARTLSYNSAIKSLGFTTIFSEFPDLIEDGMLSGRIDVSVPHVIHFSDDLSDIEDVVDNLVEYINTCGETYTIIIDQVPVSGKSVDITTPSGRVLRIATVTDEQSPYYGHIHMTDIEGNSLSELAAAEGDAMFNNIVTFVDGTKASFWDVINSVNENYELSNNLNLLAQAVSKEKPSISDITSVTSSWINSKWSSVRDLAAQVIQAFHTGGVYGVVMKIYSFYKKASTVGVDDDGLLTFTDNTQLVPASYLTGIMATVGNTLLQVAGAICSMFSRVVGMIASAVGGLVSSIISAVNYDYQTATTATIIDTWSSDYPLAPHGLFATTVQLDVSNCKQFVLDGQLLGFFVPGGVLLCSARSDGMSTFEFHPDLVDRRGLKSQLITVSDPTDTNWGTVDLFVPRASALMSLIDEGDSSTPQFIFNNSDGVLTADSDEVLRQILFFNTLLFTMWQYVSVVDTHHIYVTQERLGGFRWKVDNGTEYYNQLIGGDQDACRAVIGLAWLCGVPSVSMYTLGVSSDWAGLATIAGWLNKHGAEGDATTNFGIFMHLNAKYYQYAYTTGHDYYGEPFLLSSNLTWAIATPKYDRASFVANLILTGVIAVTAIAVTAVATIAVTKAISNVRANLKSKAESAWDRLKASPTAENYTAYRKAAKKNNLFVKIFGGTSVSISDYWGPSSSSSSEILSEIGSQLEPVASTETDALSETGQVSMIDLIDLIRGPIVPPVPSGD